MTGAGSAYVGGADESTEVAVAQFVALVLQDVLEDVADRRQFAHLALDLRHRRDVGRRRDVAHRQRLADLPETSNGNVGWPTTQNGITSCASNKCRAELMKCRALGNIIFWI